MNLPEIIIKQFPKIEYKKNRIKLVKKNKDTEIIHHKDLEKILSKEFINSYLN
jgi:hypothetical protein